MSKVTIPKFWWRWIKLTSRKVWGSNRKRRGRTKRLCRTSIIRSWWTMIFLKWTEDRLRFLHRSKHLTRSQARSQSVSWRNMKFRKSKSLNSPLNGAIITRRLRMQDTSKKKCRSSYGRNWWKTSRNMGIIDSRGDITSQWCSLWRVIGPEWANKFIPIASMVNSRWLWWPISRPGLAKIHHGWVNLTTHLISVAVISMQQASVAL